ncbi:MAG: YqgE/AlgH family protein [Candidatus Pelagadaptatus aseana]|uniref:YqgE/AlgH family protein n=1 Tax=Candidatus Pelagadaptatus aseana TaxID=3120508 RepID=UPI0039B33EC3
MTDNTPTTENLNSLGNQFLIAMPSLNNSFFSHTITLMCNHDSEGAMGLVINQPLEDVQLADIYSQLGIDNSELASHAETTVMCGGPVSPERGFVLHSADSEWNSTLSVSDDISLTASQDILHAIAAGKGPEKFLVMLGYAGWDANQLEDEIADNAWLTSAADSDIVFDTPAEHRWAAASANLGINLDLIPNAPGHA